MVACRGDTCIQVRAAIGSCGLQDSTPCIRVFSHALYPPFLYFFLYFFLPFFLSFFPQAEAEKTQERETDAIIADFKERHEKNVRELRNHFAEELPRQLDALRENQVWKKHMEIIY